MRYIHMFLKASFFVDLGCSRWNAEGETYQHPLLVESAACWARNEQLNHSVSNNRLWEILCGNSLCHWIFSYLCNDWTPTAASFFIFNRFFLNKLANIWVLSMQSLDSTLGVTTKDWWSWSISCRLPYTLEVDLSDWDPSWLSQFKCPLLRESSQVARAPAYCACSFTPTLLSRLAGVLVADFDHYLSFSSIWLVWDSKSWGKFSEVPGLL